jgi:hypothetical protein
MGGWHHYGEREREKDRRRIGREKAREREGGRGRGDLREGGKERRRRNYIALSLFELIIVFPSSRKTDLYGDAFFQGHGHQREK